MTHIESTERSHELRAESRWSVQATLAAASGGLGIAAAVWGYWLVLPGLVLGVVAIVLGGWSRRRGAREAGTVAVALGIVSVLLVPSVLMVVDDAESWGRNCALRPTNPDC